MNGGALQMSAGDIKSNLSGVMWHGRKVTIDLSCCYKQDDTGLLPPDLHSHVPPIPLNHSFHLQGQAANIILLYVNFLFYVFIFYYIIPEEGQNHYLDNIVHYCNFHNASVYFYIWLAIVEYNM